EVRCTRFGTTPQGRPMWALVASQSGALTPDAARRRGLPVTLIQGGIHAGEIEGKDAGFIALREQLTRPGALRQQVLVFVPVFNA
ncbi:M14 family zinc carboxypeptidase, partial [Acinetobacter baumannii]